MGCYQKLERDSFTSFLLILCVRAYNCGFYGSVTQIEQNRESRLQKKKRRHRHWKVFFSAEEAEALISDNTISYKLHFAYYRTTGDIIGLRMKEKKKKKKKNEDTISPSRMTWLLIFQGF